MKPWAKKGHADSGQRRRQDKDLHKRDRCEKCGQDLFHKTDHERLRTAAISLLGHYIGLIEWSYHQMGKEYLAKEPVEKLRKEYEWLHSTTKDSE